MGEDLLANTAKGNTSPDLRGGSLSGSQREDLKDVATNEGACVPDLPGNPETYGQKSGTPEGTAIKPKGSRARSTDIPEIF